MKASKIPETAGIYQCPVRFRTLEPSQKGILRTNEYTHKNIPALVIATRISISRYLKIAYETIATWNAARYIPTGNQEKTGRLYTGKKAVVPPEKPTTMPSNRYLNWLRLTPELFM